MATTGAHRTRATPPTRGACSRADPAILITGASSGARSGYARRTSGRPEDPARARLPPQHANSGNPPTPAYPRSVRRVARQNGEWSRRARRRPKRVTTPPQRPPARSAGNEDASVRVTARTRAPARSSAVAESAEARERPGVGSTAIAGTVHASGNFQRLGKDRDPRSKRRSTRSRARGLPPRFFFGNGPRAPRVFFFGDVSRTSRSRRRRQRGRARRTKRDAVKT